MQPHEEPPRDPEAKKREHQQLVTFRLMRVIVILAIAVAVVLLTRGL